MENPQFRVISDETRALIDRLLPEQISLAGIARVAGVSETWLQTYVNKKYRSIPRKLRIRARKSAR
ncbi:MAG: hypothetical protein HC884_07115 [Chloroflexaceae bacterium]|nr:hypothetical protein [Chloroflexaceae bacterium]